MEKNKKQTNAEAAVLQLEVNRLKEELKTKQQAINLTNAYYLRILSKHGIRL